MSPTQAYARIQVTVEVDAPGTYDGEATMDFLHRQGTREAVTKLQGLLAGKARIIGEPKTLLFCAERSK